VLSAKCPAAYKGLARSKALLASSNRASAGTIPLLTWARAACARAGGGGVLSKLGLERVGDKPDEDVALFHARALVGQHLGDPQTLNLRPDQNLLPGNQRTRHQHGLAATRRPRLCASRARERRPAT
jgi:hypothetical protein